MQRTSLIPRTHLNRDELISKKIVYLTPGHAPSMVATIGPTGGVNIGTFEQTMVVSYRPPRLLLAISPNSDTYKNICDGSDVVVGFPRLENIQQAYDCGIKVSRDVSELDLVRGISTYRSNTTKAPSIEQCWVNLECRLWAIMIAGDHSLVLLDVNFVSLDEALWHEDNVDLRTGLPACYYTTAGNFFTAERHHKVTLSEDLRRFTSND
jgi:flavin reductase (DIM6/NTAB) family NADH-FMN oxidoreductase RutF